MVPTEEIEIATSRGEEISINQSELGRNVGKNFAAFQSNQLEQG